MPVSTYACVYACVYLCPCLCLCLPMSVSTSVSIYVHAWSMFMSMSMLPAEPQAGQALFVISQLFSILLLDFLWLDSISLLNVR